MRYSKSADTIDRSVRTFGITGISQKSIGRRL